MSSDTTPLKTVLRAFEVVDILQEKDGGTPSEVATELGVTRATAHDYLVSLETTGYVVGENGHYQLSYRLLQQGNQHKYRSHFFHAAIEPMVNLHSETSEITHIGIEEGGEFVLLHNINDTKLDGKTPYSGFRQPLYTHASGKVLLAEMPDEHRENILDSISLDSITDQTIVDRTELMNQLEQITQDGYAVDWDEQIKGIGFVSAPVKVNDELLGSVSVHGSTSKFQREEYQESLINSVRATADQIQINYQQLRGSGIPPSVDTFNTV